ncbi:spore germination protein [Alkalihalobacillus sp. 1P02AB]|uniref:spore germination protein n=1 Tax=Alkalihalobacillus sp. 1P02AB TaxID=3132260 RepID=UPI0039A67E35
MEKESSNHQKTEKQMTYDQKASQLIQSFSHTEDFVVREMVIGEKKIIFCFIESLIDKEKLSTTISLLTNQTTEGTPLEKLVRQFEMEKTDSELIHSVMIGKVPLFIEGFHVVPVLDIKLFMTRSPEEPSNERVIRGSHDGFLERLNSNINILRNRIPNSDFTVKYFTIGKLSKTQCAMVYVNGIVDQGIVSQIENRLNLIEIDYVTNTGSLEEFLEESTLSPFPQMLSTERPDRTAANILDGRVAIMVNGTPGVLILPVSFFAFYQSPDDYSTRWLTGSFYRQIRLLSFFLATCLPAIYISIISFHSEVIPKGLVLLVKKSIEEIPYPPIVEAFILELTLELLREAGVRLPNPLGQTIGIVGGLVIGDAVVRAGLVSNIMIVVVALTALSSFIVPTHEMSATVRLIRFPLMLSAAVLGFVGISYGLLFLFIHICRLTPYGMPYFSPLAPLKINHIKDTFIRLPVSKQKKNDM